MESLSWLIDSCEQLELLPNNSRTIYFRVDLDATTNRCCWSSSYYGPPPAEALEAMEVWPCRSLPTAPEQVARFVQLTLDQAMLELSPF